MSGNETATTTAPLPEYPRPQLQRDSYINLNGRWQFAVTDSDAGPGEFPLQITVPFSPECPLSGLSLKPGADDRLWYRRRFTAPGGDGLLLLHFGAVDQRCSVYVNGALAGTHCGGYLPFSFDITELLRGANNELCVCARDEGERSGLSRGKQCAEPSGIWYAGQSGIWQSVWLEQVPRRYITDLKITPLFDDAAVEITALSSLPGGFSARVARDGVAVASGSTAGAALRLPLPDFCAWTPDEPTLYDLELSAGEDRVRSYFAMRKWDVVSTGSGPEVRLNNKKFFFNGLLDQGYWPGGMYTAAADSAIISDITTAKELGYNMLRKHIKIEPLRWYYHCDRLGMCVWQDLPSGGGKYDAFTIYARHYLGTIGDGPRNYRRLGRADAAGRQFCTDELRGMVALLYNSPCVAAWVPFNEGWGQFDAAAAYKLVKALDPTRLVDHASGWFDQGCGDFKSEHVYFRKYRFRHDRRGRPVVLSEFGGYYCAVGGTGYANTKFVYKRISDRAQLSAALEKLYRDELIPAARLGLCGCVYTQLSDVAGELNGIVDFSRAVVKPDAAKMRKLNAELMRAALEDK